MFITTHEEKLSPESLRILDYILSDSKSEEYPHITAYHTNEAI